jgi:ParB-like chromosome segregation protein Spo0J
MRKPKLHVVGEEVEFSPLEIDRRGRVRSDLGDLRGLTDSIRTNGQLQPILVRWAEKSGRWVPRLIAGERRCKVCEILGITVRAIVGTVKDEYEALAKQLDENLARKSFDPLEEGEGLLRLKKLYEELHPQVRHGAAGGGNQGKGTRTKTVEVERFSKIAARQMSCSESKVAELMQVASVPEEVKRAIRKAPSSAERSKAVRRVISSVRREKRVARLEGLAKMRERRAPDGAESEVVPEAEARCILKLGDNNDFFAAAEPESFDLILTDPEYGLDWTTISHSGRSELNRDVAWDVLDVGWVAKAAPLVAQGGSIIAFCAAEWVGFYKMVFAGLGLHYLGHMVWEKTNPATQHRPGYQMATEHIVWAAKGSPYFRPPENSGSDHNVFRGPTCGGHERVDHETQKPLWILRHILDRHALPNMRVLDPFAGVCSVLVACKERGICCVGVEKEDKYVHQGRLRLQATTTEKDHGKEEREDHQSDAVAG